MLNWDNLRIFLTAVRAGNYTTASERLRINRTTIGRRIERLEYQLGTTLFEQGDEGHYPTRAGKCVLEAAAEVERILSNVTMMIAEAPDQRRIRLRVSVAAELGTEMMSDIVRFADQEPEVQIEVRTSAFPREDVISRKADLCICLADAATERLRGPCVAQLYQAAYASDRYLARHGYEAASNLHEWIKCSNLTYLPAFRRWNVSDDVKVAALVDSWSALRDAAEAGLGAAYLWTFVGGKLKRLTQLAPVNTDVSVGLWLLARADIPLENPTRLMMEYLAETLPQTTLRS